MTPNQKAWIQQLTEDASSLMDALRAENSFEKVEEVLGRLRMDLLNLRPSPEEDERIKEAWTEITERLKRTRQLFELRAPRMILEYEMKWLKLRVSHYEQRLNGHEPSLTLEEINLKRTDLYDL